MLFAADGHLPPLFLLSAVTSSTIVSCAEVEGNTKAMELSTASHIEIEILVPNENFVPTGVLRRAGNFVMQRVVDIGVPQVKFWIDTTVVVRHGIIIYARSRFGT